MGSSKFKIGDEVQLKGSYIGHKAGKVGIVVRLGDRSAFNNTSSDETPGVEVRFRDGSTLYGYDYRWEAAKVETEEVTILLKDIKPDDTIISDSSRWFDRLGMETSITVRRAKAPSIELPTKLGSIIQLKDAETYGYNSRAVFLRTGTDGWQRTDKLGYLSNTEVLALVLQAGGFTDFTGFGTKVIAK